MGRNKSNNVDYFPCYCKDGKVVFILESHWGNNGFSFFYRLWKQLGDADFHYIDLRQRDTWEYFKAKMKIPETETELILQKLAEMKVIDLELWQHRIIWSDSFVESIADVWLKRKRNIPQKPTYLIQKTALSVQEVDTGDISGPEGTQSKVKESKEDIYTPIFESWNSQKLIKHRKLTDKMRRAINGILDEFTQEEIIKAIGNYSEIINDPVTYYFNHRWTLEDFMRRGTSKFVAAADPRSNFRKSDIIGKGKNNDILKEFD